MVEPIANGQPPIAASGDVWLATQCSLVAAGDVTALAIAFGQAGRRHPDPAAARMQLALAIPSTDPERWLVTLERLFATAALEEQVALYRGLSRFPHPQRLQLRAATGIRSTMQAVFEAIALDHDYPCAWLATDPLNQMVLKAFFLGCDHTRIRGLQQRANPDLARMLTDYRRERLAAGRLVPAGLDEVVGWCQTSSSGERGAGSVEGLRPPSLPASAINSPLPAPRSPLP